MSIKAKKYLGQHFLTDNNIAFKIAETLPKQTRNVLEIGPGMGVLTRLLLKENFNLKVAEIDSQAVDYLINNKIIDKNNIFKTDFFTFFGDEEFAIIGNFPYNISSQILFRTLENRAQIPVFSGMFQKEVAERIAMKPGSKAYGILSVLSQAFYDVEYLFSVPPTVFKPPPKVDSGVIRMIRKDNFSLDCNEKIFFQVVKTAFNFRRKMLRTSLKSLVIDKTIFANPIFTKRPEQLGYAEFVDIVNLMNRS